MNHHNLRRQTSAPEVATKRTQFEMSKDRLAFLSKDGVMPGLTPLEDGVPFVSSKVVRKEEPAYENAHAGDDPMARPAAGPPIPRPAPKTHPPVPAKPSRARIVAAAEGRAALSDEDETAQRNQDMLNKLKRLQLSRRLSCESSPKAVCPLEAAPSPPKGSPHSIPISLTSASSFAFQSPHNFPEPRWKEDSNAPHSRHSTPVRCPPQHPQTVPPLDVPVLMGVYLGAVPVNTSLRGITNNVRLQLAGMCRDIIVGSSTYVICDGIEVGEREEKDMNAKVIIYLGADNILVMIPSSSREGGRKIALHRLHRIGLVHGFTDGSCHVVYVGHNECTGARAAVAVELESEDAKGKLVDHVLSRNRI